MNNLKISKAAETTDRILEHMDVAHSQLAHCQVNGAGVLADRSNVRHSLITARDHILAAIKELDENQDWPTNEDYD
jgi:hypothetical protein